MLEQQRFAGFDSQRGNSCGRAGLECLRAHDRDIEAKIVIVAGHFHGQAAAFATRQSSAPNQAGVGTFECFDCQNSAPLDHHTLPDFKLRNCFRHPEAKLKVRLLLAQLGIPFERIEYDTDHGATRTPDFLSTKNLNGRVPVLQLPDGRCLPESNAILWYLAEGTPYLPSAEGEDGRWLRAQVLQWLFFEQYSHEPHIATLRQWTTHGLEMTPERTAAFIKNEIAKWAPVIKSAGVKIE